MKRKKVILTAGGICFFAMLTAHHVIFSAQTSNATWETRYAQGLLTGLLQKWLEQRKKIARPANFAI